MLIEIEPGSKLNRDFNSNNNNKVRVRDKGEEGKRNRPIRVG
jgi:hypothetical protein